MKNNFKTYSLFFFLLLLYSCGRVDKTKPKEPIGTNPISFLGSFESYGSNSLLANVEETLDVSFPMTLSDNRGIIGQKNITVSILRYDGSQIVCEYILTNGTYSANDNCVNKHSLRNNLTNPKKIPISSTDKIIVTNVSSILNINLIKH